MAAEEGARGQGPETQNDQRRGTSLAGQWSGCRASTAGRAGAAPGPGTEILHAAWHGQKVGKQKPLMTP